MRNDVMMPKEDDQSSWGDVILIVQNGIRCKWRDEGRDNEYQLYAGMEGIPEQR
jgi:hypothetical protein